MTDNEEPIKDEEKKETDPESTSTEQPESTTEEQKKEEEKPEEKAEEKVEEKAEEKPEEKPVEEPKELTKEDIITILKTFPGVGQVTAERIYNAGHDSRENLQKASAADLQKVRGIGKALAEQIASGLETAIKRFDKPESEKAAGEKVPGITEKTLGFIKGTVSKITGFFKGKSPKPKPKPAGEGGAVKVEGAPETRDVGEVKTADAAAEGSEAESEVKEAVKEKYFPKVGASEEGKPDEKEPVPEHEPGKVEPEAPQENKPETKPEPEETTDSTAAKPVREPEQKVPEINLTESSGLLKWFESTPSLNSNSGRLLFKAGYNNLQELKEAEVEDLALVDGLDQQEAKEIYKELQKI